LKPSFFVRAGGTNVTSGSGSTSMTNGVWYHYVGVYDGAKVYSYLNGVLQASASATGTLGAGTPTNPMEIGATKNGNNLCAGSLADVRLYNRALSPEEINIIYLQGLQPLPPEEPMIITDGASTGTVGFTSPADIFAITGINTGVVGFTSSSDVYNLTSAPIGTVGFTSPSDTFDVEGDVFSATATMAFTSSSDVFFLVDSTGGSSAGRNRVMTVGRGSFGRMGSS
jgi:hypothetical protein